MRIAAALSARTDTSAAVADAVEQLRGRVGYGERSLCVLVVSPRHGANLAAAMAEMRRALRPRTAIGAVAGGVVGPGRQSEAGAALSIWCASLPRAQVTPVRTWALDRPDGGMSVVGWPDTEPEDLVLLFADPFTYPAARVLRRIGQRRPGHRVAGGLVSSGARAAALAIDGRVYEDGGVGVLLRGVRTAVTVSPGCRPVGEVMTVTAAEGGAVLELAGAPALDRLREIVDGADERGREALRTGLRLGVVVDEYRERFEVGDFVVRTVLGVDERRRAIVVGERVEVGQTVQFQVRDADMAAADLRRRLEHVGPSAGGLLFTGNGRGRSFFGMPDHDVRQVEERLRSPVAGALCHGEIGPLGAANHVHGDTASVVSFLGAGA